MLFNDNITLSLESIRNATNISESELRRHLLSLCTPKLKILKKFSKGKGIVDDDSFTFNDEFTSKFKRMKVPLISDAAGNMANFAARGTYVCCTYLFSVQFCISSLADSLSLSPSLRLSLCLSVSLSLSLCLSLYLSHTHTKTSFFTHIADILSYRR